MSSALFLCVNLLCSALVAFHTFIVYVIRYWSNMWLYMEKLTHWWFLFLSSKSFVICECLCVLLTWMHCFHQGDLSRHLKTAGIWSRNTEIHRRSKNSPTSKLFLIMLKVVKLILCKAYIHRLSFEKMVRNTLNMIICLVFCNILNYLWFLEVLNNFFQFLL